MRRSRTAKGCSLLSLDTESLSASTGRLGTLTSNSVTPVVSETSVLLRLSHSLKILTHDSIDLIGNKLSPGTFTGVVLSIEEPLGDIVISGSSDDVRDVLDLLLGQFTSSLMDIDGSLLESKEGESSTNTLDLTETEGGLLLTIKIGVLKT